MPVRQARTHVEVRSAAEIENVSRAQLSDPLWAYNTQASDPSKAFLASLFVATSATTIERMGSSARLRAQMWSPQASEYVWVEPVDEPNHELCRLLNEPVKQWSQKRWLSTIILDLLTGGETYLEKIRASALGISQSVPGMGLPGRLYPWHRGEMHVHRASTGRRAPEEYQLLNAPDRDRLPLTDVIPVLLPRPGDRYRGMGPTEYASPEAQADQAARTWQTNSYHNRARPDLAFTFHQTMNGQQSTEVQEYIRENWGGIENAGVPIGFGNLADVKMLGFNAAEMDFVQSRDQIRKFVAAAFGVPSVFQDVSGSTYANLAVAQNVLWDHTIRPMLDVVVDALNINLAPEYGGQYRIAADVQKIDAQLPVEEAKWKIVEKMAAHGVPMSQINDRLQLGLKPYPGWNHSYRRTNTVRVVEDEGDDTATQPSTPDNEDVIDAET